MPFTTPIAYTSDFGIQSDGYTRVPAQTLDQGDFLKLLVTQMTSQDPLNPKSDLDSIAQMASFSALEQSKSMEAQMQQLTSQQQILQANSMIGRTVTLQLDSNTATTGVVDGVQIDSGIPRVVVGGHAFDLSQVLTIQPTVNTDGQP
jgi:flagellar basal-body rod modification protein FlgD